MKVIIRTENAGVHFGTLTKKEGAEVTLDDSVRLWYWAGACSLSQLAIDGTKKPEECKFSVATQGHQLLGVIEIIPCSGKAIKSIEGVSSWKL